MSESQSIQVETSELSPALREIRVEVAAARVDQAFEQSYRELSRQVRVRGFRPGKVPRGVLEKMYGTSVAQDLERKLVGETLADAVQQAELKPLCEPQIQAGLPVRGEDYRYTATVEVRPAIEFPPLSEVTGQRPAVAVEDEEIDRELAGLQERHARLVEEASDVKATPGHVLTIDYLGTVDGEPFEGGKGQGMEIELGSGRLVEGFEDQLVGATPDSDVEVRVTFPEEYGAEALQGRDAVFQVHVVSVQRRELPELDDEFAKDLGDFETLDDIRNRIRDDLTTQRLQTADDAARKSVLSSLIEKTEFDVPPGVIEQELHHQMQSMQRRFQGQVPDDVLRQELSRIHESGREGAERRVRETFLLAQIADEQDFEVSDADVNQRLEEMAEGQGMDAAQMRQMADAQGWRGAIAAELRERKAVDFLLSEASVDEVTASESSPESTES